MCKKAGIIDGRYKANMKTGNKNLEESVTKLMAKITVAGLVLVMFAGCSTGSRYADLDEFMAEIQSRPKPPMIPLPTFEPYQAFTYGAQALRSPFVPPVILPPGEEATRLANLGVKPPPNHVKQFLEKFSLASLMMVGTLARDDNIWALIKDGEDTVHMVKIGDYMGTNYGKVESIDDNRIDITEIVGDSNGGWARRPRTIVLTPAAGK